MDSLKISEGIVPLSDFKARASDWLKKVAQTGEPIVITQNGRAAAVLLSPVEFDALTEQARFLQAVAEGMTDADEGRLTARETSKKCKR